MKGEKGGIKRFFSGLLALVVLGGATLGGLELWGAGKQKPSNWFKQEVAEEGEADLIAGNVVMGDNEQNGIALTAYALSAEEYAENGVSEEAETAVKIKVNFTPANTTDKRLRASLSFKNAQSTWASGKTVTDYVTASVNQQEILLTCSEAFGEKIELRIDTNHENVYATVAVDYIARPTEVVLDIGSLIQTGMNNGKPIYNFDDYDPIITFNEYKYVFDPFIHEFGVGTLRPSIRATKAELTFKEQLLRDCGLYGPCHVGYVSPGGITDVYINGRDDVSLYLFTADQEMVMKMLHSQVNAETVLEGLTRANGGAYPYIDCKSI
ncbi:MAG: hypothetical protein OSJ39_03830 [Clostridia bacterium]|nr:hypothetical protein [Clostridia bacterium]